MLICYTYSHRIGSSTITLSYDPKGDNRWVNITLKGGPDDQRESRRQTLGLIVDRILGTPELRDGVDIHTQSTPDGMDFVCKDNRIPNCEFDISPKKALNAINSELEKLAGKYKSFGQLQRDVKAGAEAQQDEAWRKHLADQDQREAAAREAVKAVIEKALQQSDFNPAYATEIMRRAGDNICDAVMQHMQSQGAKIGG